MSYALAPVTFLAIAGFLAVIIMMTAYVVKGNRSYNRTIHGLWEEIEESYSTKLNEFCTNPLVVEYTRRGESCVDLAQELYDFRTESPISGHFYWLDRQRQVLAANSAALSSYLITPYPSPVGILKKIQGAPSQISLSVETLGEDETPVLCMGRAIEADGEILGVLIFEISEEDIRGGFREENGIHYIITNSFRRALWYSSDLYIAPYGKIRAELGDTVVCVTDRWTYVTCSEAADGFLQIYTVTELGMYVNIMKAILFTFVLVFLALLIFIYITADIVAARQTRSVSQIVEAMSNISHEKLGVPLELSTGDELEDIAVSYNKMTEDVKQLLARNEEMGRQNVISEIKQLELQLEPHFLYNTLELIRFMTKIDPDNVGRVISALGSLLRQSINMDQSMLTVGEELEYCRSYLLIQKYRFRDKLEYELTAEERAESLPIPKRIIQPLIENALKYGTDERGFCRIRTEIVVEGGNLLIRVSDEGRGLTEERLAQIRQMLGETHNDSRHNGLYNIHRRVVLTYGEGYGVSVNNGEKGAVFGVCIPFEERGKEDV